MSQKRLFLDPGHGGNDPGAMANGLREKDLNLQIAQDVFTKLMLHWNITVEMSRNKDVFVSLGDRVKHAREFGPDWFFSIHCNAASSPDANGYEDYVHPQASELSKAFRNRMHPFPAAHFELHNRTIRGRREANFFVLRETPMPACLIECGFLTNQRDAELLKDNAFLDALGTAIVRGIASALELSPKKPKQEEESSPALEEQATLIADTLLNIERAVDEAERLRRGHAEIMEYLDGEILEMKRLIGLSGEGG